MTALDLSKLIPAPEPAAREVSSGRLLTLEQILQDPEALKQPPVVAPRLAWLGRVSMLTGREKWACFCVPAAVLPH